MQGYPRARQTNNTGLTLAKLFNNCEEPTNCKVARSASIWVHVKADVQEHLLNQGGCKRDPLGNATKM
eukprot:1431044-Amphidinium_carterae.2